ncbi:hypothetical protein HBO32_16200 [Pseudomonas nitroreducens]|uniref:hypothetical protein n=1 Tax=Pseudomonas nitroreducens TaxID=46680 RepID=UPI001474321C|nr:hypothetical protein [Pseudomonas nitroreducens]NMZ74652.1 hypothetical protein [Pseudomonas nitroreducens]
MHHASYNQKAVLLMVGGAFFFSGVAGLLYQVVWQRLLFLALGVDIRSVTIIVSVFMLGLGVGGRMGGVLSDRYRGKCVMLFALFEFLVGIAGLLSIGFFSNLGIAGGSWMAWVGAFVVLIVPTTLMGASLPLLAVSLVERGESVGGAVGWLYFYNTLGAAFSCYFLGFWIFEFFGLRAVILIAVMLNFLVAAMGGLLWRGR